MAPSQFDPTADPIILLPSGQEWDAFGKDLIAQYRNDIFFLHVEVKGGTAIVEAEVGSTEFAERLHQMVSVRTGVNAVTDRIQVTGVLVPAQRTDVGDWALQMPPTDNDAEVARYPALRPVGQPQVGSLFELEVDLALQPEEGSQEEALRIHDLDENWTELEIRTRLICRELDMLDADSVKQIVVKRDAPSIACRFVGRVNERATADGVVAVTVTFEHKGRYSGSSQARFTILDAVQRKPESARSQPRPAFAVSPKAAAPELTITIDTAANDGHSIWHVSSASLGGVQGRGQVALPAPPRDYFKQLFSTAQFYDVNVHQRRLKTIGESIWGVAPDAFRSLYAELHGRCGPNFPIQFVTNDAYVPWEMMHPTGIEGADHLFMTHPVARWPFSRPVNRFAPGDVVSFVPEYEEGALPAALGERTFITDELGGVLGKPCYADFLEFLSSTTEAVQIVHFAGHGSTDQGSQRGLRFENDQWVALEDLDSSISLGKSNGSLFVLNACAVAGQDIGLVVESWPQRLIELDFGGVVAPLWAVQDQHASQVVRAALTGFYKDGKTLGESMRSARASHRSSSATPYAYMCFGDVMARGGR